LAYYDGIRAERLPAALIQAQRDFFGAHTYHRVDKEGTFHTEWSADRSERQVGEAFKQEVPEAKESEKAPATSA
jgi:6-phosphogluconate dehydrogenase